MKGRRGVLQLWLCLSLAAAMGLIIYAASSASAPWLPLPPEQFASPWQTLCAQFVLAFLLLSAGMLLMLLLWSEQHIASGRRLSVVNLALFIILAAIWVFFDSRAPFSLFDNFVTARLFAYFSFYLMAVPFLFFVRDTCRHGGQVFDLLAVLFLLNFAANYLYLPFHRLEFPPTLFVTHVLMAVSVGVGLGYSLLELRCYKNEQARELLLGLVVFSVFCGVNLVLFYTVLEQGYSQYMMVGLFLFICFLVAGAVRRMGGVLSRALVFENVAACIPGGVFRAKNDDHLTITYANDAFYRLYGYSGEAEARAEGFLCADQVVTEAEQVNQLRRRQIAAGIYSFELETQEVDRFGRSIWMLNRLTYQPDSDEIFGTMIDITDRKRAEERLHVSEEEYRLAAEQSDNAIVRYDLRTRTLYQPAETAAIFGLKTEQENMPQALLETGVITPETRGDCQDFYQAMHEGQPSGSAVLRLREATSGRYRWFSAKYVMAYGRDETPLRAVITYEDITELREKELAYKKWRQSIETRPPAGFTLFESNLTLEKVDRVQGQLLSFRFSPGARRFNAQVADYANRRIHPEDVPAYIALLEREQLLAAYAQGDSAAVFEYRELLPEGVERWIRLNVQMVGYPDSSDVKIYLLYEDIDAEKSAALSIQARSQQDALTGLLNRSTFIEGVDELLSHSDQETQHALLMIDIDNFKHINDSLGHMVGDNVLISVARSLRSLLREGDLIARIGGDEFMLCLKNIPHREVAEKRADAVCRLLESDLPGGLRLTGSLGVALFPGDGQDFRQLYQSADHALYRAKDQGRNCYVCFNSELAEDDFRSNLSPIDNQICANAEAARYRVQLNALLEHLPGGVLLVGAADDGFELLYASPGLPRSVGRDPGQGELDFQAFINMINAEDRPGLLAACSDGVERGSFEYCCRIQEADGSLGWRQVNGAAVPYEGYPYPTLILVIVELTQQPPASR